MRKYGVIAGFFGIGTNFVLFTIKLYIALASGSLSIYCDAVNNLFDTFACIVALFGFILIKKLDEKRSGRLQSLFSFLIGLLIAFCAAYFVYNGLERLFYPTPVSYLTKYAVLLGATIVIKIVLGFLFKAFNKKVNSSVLKALSLDSFLDCFITLFALMSLILVDKVRFAVDGVFAIICGTVIAVSAVKNLVKEAKFLINN